MPIFPGASLTLTLTANVHRGGIRFNTAAGTATLAILLSPIEQDWLDMLSPQGGKLNG
jgi:hypothetical protein